MNELKGLNKDQLAILAGERVKKLSTGTKFTMSDLFDIDKWLDIELKIRNHAGIAFKSVIKRSKGVIKLESVEGEPQRYKIK